VSTSEERVWDDAHGSCLEPAEGGGERADAAVQRCSGAVRIVHISWILRVQGQGSWVVVALGGVAVGFGAGIGFVCCVKVVG
jgi:hypothetical protein